MRTTSLRMFINEKKIILGMVIEDKKIRLIGHCLFDGWINKRKYSKYAVGFSNKNIVLVKQFKDDMKTVYNLSNLYTRTRDNGVIEVEVFNKNTFNKLNNEVKNIKNKLNSRHKILIFLKSFWDDEGNVNFYPASRTKKLRGRCSDLDLLNYLIKLHDKIGLKVNKEYDNKGLIISRKDMIIKFKNLIGFSEGVKVCRGNGVNIDRWLNFEKNFVLNKMIKSYN